MNACFSFMFKSKMAFAIIYPLNHFGKRVRVYVLDINNELLESSKGLSRSKVKKYKNL